MSSTTPNLGTWEAPYSTGNRKKICAAAGTSEVSRSKAAMATTVMNGKIAHARALWDRE